MNKFFNKYQFQTKKERTNNMLSDPKEILKKEGQNEIGSTKLKSGKDFFYWSPFKGLHNSPSDQTAFRGNRNFCVSGGTGTGKTIFCKQAILNVLAEGGKVLVFDKEKDYYNMCLEMRGDYLTGDKASDLSVDLFSMIPGGNSSGEQYERGVAFSFLTSLILMMDLPEESFKGENKIHIEKALGSVWREKSKDGQFIDVINALKIKDCLNRDDAIKRGIMLSNSLSQYLAQWHSYFNTDKKSYIKSDFTVVDISSPDKTIAQTLMTWTLMRVWHHQQTTNNSQRFLVIFEDSLGFEPSKEFSTIIELFSLSARKKGISLGKVVSGVRDVSKENTSNYGIFEKAFWDCAECKIFFRDESINDFELFVDSFPAEVQKSYLKVFNSLYEKNSQFSFAMSSVGHPLRLYMTYSEGDSYATAA